ncbi:acetyl-CoA carboxylase carboxyl transferase subunit beta [Candidatus Marinamargulisbacteria bacterium SCGC AG-410-N11]|nr:acetyl-CoA carboxylase carboxyl transferase subunit beta [Candidatus Marinamargulisbacteria bacterium SCGC AG-410-N11]
MSILDWFANKKNLDKKKSIKNIDKLNIPGNLWVKCPKCSEVLFSKDLELSYKVCSKCSFHFRITPEERIDYLLDNNSFVELDKDIKPVDFLKFEDTEPYEDRLIKAQEKSKYLDAIIIGTAKINGIPVNIGIMNFFFMGGSMGSVVGEKITRIIENGIETKNPVIIFTSSGGARMQEGILSLMQMAKTSAAISKLSSLKIPYITVLCDPTTGGTSASFAMLGDIQIAEPGALISFAGPRVIEQTIKQKIPSGFQRSEFLLDHGMIDNVVHRKDLKKTLKNIISILQAQEENK